MKHPLIFIDFSIQFDFIFKPNPRNVIQTHNSHGLNMHTCKHTNMFHNSMLFVLNKKIISTFLSFAKDKQETDMMKSHVHSIQFWQPSAICN